MKKLLLLTLCSSMTTFALAQIKFEWVATTPNLSWQPRQVMSGKTSVSADVTIETNKPQQTIEGFGTCFNELGWTSLNFLSRADRESIMKELFAPNIGANFTICRMPVGANDFSRKWYSYNETPDDFSMQHFSIANDQETLIPFIKNAQRYNPRLKIWASPWSPPTWMKYNRHYAAMSLLGNLNIVSEEYGIDFNGINNGLPKDREGKEGTDMFIQEEKYYKAYALYFSKFITAYKKQGITISMVMPQNEFNSAQPFPSCTWTAAGLARFIPFLGKEMKPLGVSVFFGTMERPNAKLVDTSLTNPESAPYIKGAGFQWAGKDALPVIHQNYPGLQIYQSEQECGNGKNDWKHCLHAWDLMKHYFSNGTSAYMYWNTSLLKGSISSWGWKQNSLVIVDSSSKTYQYSYEYYLLKHVSHFVKPGAKKLATSGAFNNLLAFENPDKSVVVVFQNDSPEEKPIHISVNGKIISGNMPANSINTILAKL